MVLLLRVPQMVRCPHGGDLMAWCNNRLEAGKGKIMDCKKYMFIDTFARCFHFCRVNLLGVPHDAVGKMSAQDEILFQQFGQVGRSLERGPCELHLPGMKKPWQNPPGSTGCCKEPLTESRWMHSTKWGAQLSPLHLHLRDVCPSRTGPDPISLSPAHPGSWAVAPALLAAKMWLGPPCKLTLRRGSLGNLCNESSSRALKHQLSEEAVTPLAPGPQSHLILSLPKHRASQISLLWARR